MADADREKLQAVKTFPSLVKYLREELDWPIEADNWDDLTFDYEPEELGIDPKTAAKISEIKQLRPLTSDQPWGIFFVKFEPKRLPVVALRRILSHLVVKKRASARKAEQASWNLHDLLFISNYGEGEQRQITFAHFGQEEGTSDLPTLRVLGWDDADTALHIDHVHKELKDRLHWLDDGEPVDHWRARWSSAFTLRNREVITTSKALSIRLAALATDIRKRVNTVLRFESDRGPLRKLHAAFKEALIHDLSADDFADMYAQTITYGLLSARVSRPAALVAENIADMVPVTNPFLRDLLSTFLTIGGRRGKIDFDEVGINDVVQTLRDANMEAVLRDFGDRNPQEDPVVHFYELFLKAYDPKKRMQRGVFYTPRPVVSFIVRSVHEILQKEFGLPDGLADTTTWAEMVKKHKGLEIPKGAKPSDPFVQILDPATGTATFLVEVIDVIYKTMKAKWLKAGHMALEIPKLWNEYVPDHLLPRVYGFELMMAPYAVAHMKVGLTLHETGYNFRSHERARIYLTNSLEPAHDFSDRFEFDAPALAHEAKQVNILKSHPRFTVVIGNPPYSISSANNGPWIVDLMETYKATVRSQETQIQAISDDYVKFFRFAHHCITEAQSGVLGLITNNGYLRGPIFRDMRRAVMDDFSHNYFLDLHGNSRKGETTRTDENVFDIKQGVAIALLSRLGRANQAWHADLWGRREDKYNALQTGRPATDWSSFVATPPLFTFLPGNSAGRREYDAFIPMLSLLGSGHESVDRHKCYGAGFVSQQDAFAITFTPQDVVSNVEFLLARGTDERLLRERFRMCSTTQWSFDRARSELSKREWRKALIRVLYRPFDYRYTIFDRNVVSIRRERMMRHLLNPNVAIFVGRQGQAVSGPVWSLVFCGDVPEDYNLFARGNNLCCPMWLYPEGELTHAASTRPNLSTIAAEILLRRESSYVPSLEDARNVFHYVYAILHSRTYRERYAEPLGVEFPRIPAVQDPLALYELAACGADLVALHLVQNEYPYASWNCGNRADPLRASVVAYIPQGEAKVAAGFPRFEGGLVHINEKGSFGGISEDAWTFCIGGYQVCEKWLKDRRGRVLSKEDIEHYCKIVAAIQETIRLMGEIDKVIDAHGGWPGAFITDPKLLAGLKSKKA